MLRVRNLRTGYGTLEAVTAAEALQDLDRRAHGVEGGDLEDLRVVEVGDGRRIQGEGGEAVPEDGGLVAEGDLGAAGAERAAEALRRAAGHGAAAARRGAVRAHVARRGDRHPGRGQLVAAQVDRGRLGARRVCGRRSPDLAVDVDLPPVRPDERGPAQGQGSRCGCRIGGRVGHRVAMVRSVTRGRRPPGSPRSCRGACPRAWRVRCARRSASRPRTRPRTGAGFPPPRSRGCPACAKARAAASRWSS